MTKTRGSDELSSITEAVNAQMESGRPRNRPMPAPTQLMHMSTGFNEVKNENERLKAEKGRAIVVALELCDDGPYHASPLDPERVANLKSNLAQNEQNTPAILRQKEGGRYEIIAGRHRKAALLELGRSTWEAVIRDFDDDTAERLTFYDNLFAPNLTDYAKFQSFAQRKASKAFTLERLAEESGISKSAVGRLMTFAGLPEAAHEHIKRKPGAVGASLAEALAPLVDKHADRVTQAVGLVVDGKLQASKAATWVQEAKAEPARPEETVIRRGKAIFAKLKRRDEQVVVRFTNPDDAASAVEDLETLLTKLSQRAAKRV